LTGALAGGHVLDVIRINWFLGILALELWGAAWFIAFESDIRRWWRYRWLARRWHTKHVPRRPRRAGARRQDRPA
jgi:hypothetical protein